MATSGRATWTDGLKRGLIRRRVAGKSESELLGELPEKHRQKAWNRSVLLSTFTVLGAAALIVAGFRAWHGSWNGFLGHAGSKEPEKPHFDGVFTVLGNPQRHRLPSCERVITFADEKNNGFGAQLNRVLETVAYAWSIDAVFVLPRLKHWNYGCGRYRSWDCYFEPEDDVCVTKSSTVMKVKDFLAVFTPQQCSTPLELTPIGSGCWVAGNVLSEKFVHGEILRLFRHDSPDKARSKVLELMHRSAKAVLHFNVELEGMFSKVRAALNLKPGYTAVHLRRGDKYKEVTLQPASLYADLVQKLDNGTKTVFAATDEFEAAKKLRELLLPRGFEVLTLAQENRRGHLQVTHNQLERLERYEASVEFLIELVMMAESDLFVCALSSNAARLVHSMRSRPANRTVSVDDRWHPGVAYHTFGRPYCSDVDANKAACQLGLLQSPARRWRHA